jgi:hypothetical protein
VPDYKFNLTVGEWPPILDYRREAILRNPIDDFPGFAASRVNGQPKCLWRFVRNLACQITGVNGHYSGPPGSGSFK